MVSVFDHPFLSGLFGDPDISADLGAKTEIALYLKVEAAYARALAEVGAVSDLVGNGAAEAIEGVSVDVDILRNGVARDGLAIPQLVHCLKAAIDPKFHPAVHNGLTSQDVIDTALVLRLQRINGTLGNRLSQLDRHLTDLKTAFGQHGLMARTRMQAALPITVADRIEAWQHPLRTHSQRLAEHGPRMERLQFGGPMGTAMSDDEGRALAQAFATRLDLAVPDRPWHTARDGLADYAGWLSLVTGALGKIGQDVALMAAQDRPEIRISGAGGSSAMPHKQNPIRAELLVTLARFNAVLLGGFHQSLVHEQERSGAAWTLEWMLLPQMVQTTSVALSATDDLVTSITAMGMPNAH